MKLKFTPLEFETPGHLVFATLHTKLKFTPLEFETLLDIYTLRTRDFS